MKLFFRLYVAIVLVALLADAQRTDTIYQKIVTDATMATPSASVRNIGQSQHTLFFTYTDSGGVCSMGSTARIYLEGSHDNTNFIRMTPTEAAVVNSSGSTYVGWIAAHGAFPYVRVGFGASYVNCKANGWYTGTVPTVAFPQTLLALSSNYGSAITEPGIAGDYTVVTNFSSTGRVVLYGLDVYNYSGGAVTIVLNERVNCAGAVSGTVLNRPSFPDKANVFWPTSVVPYHIGGPGKSVCATISGGPVQIKAQYRIE